MIENINDSEIVKEQKENPEQNVLTGLEFSDEEFSMDNLSAAQKQYLSSLEKSLLEVNKSCENSFSFVIIIGSRNEV